MSRKKRTLPLLSAFLVASCATSPTTESLHTAQFAPGPQPTAGWPTRVNDPLPTRSVPPRPTPIPRPTPPNTTPTDPPNVGTLDMHAYATGQARRGSDHWAFSVGVNQPPGQPATGQLLITSSMRNVTLFGTITGGTITRGSTAAGHTARLTGVLTTGQTITVNLSDLNNAQRFDRFSFEVSQGPTFTDGDVYHGVVRILRTRPLAQGLAEAEGFRFDSRIGLFVLKQDLDTERKPTAQKVDHRVLEVTAPDPIINFRKHDLGGFVAEPGSDDNVPSLIPGGDEDVEDEFGDDLDEDEDDLDDDNSGSGSGSGSGNDDTAEEDDEVVDD